MARYPLYVFDAYGTLFDVHSAVGRHRDLIGGQADRLSELWRAKQLEYTWVRSLMGAYRDFREVTADALDFAAARCGVTLAAPTRQALLDAYEVLDAFPDAARTLTALKKSGARTAVLSNGTPDMLAHGVESAGLSGLLDVCLSVDDLGIFKTAPEVYAMIERHLNVAAADVSFQSSNRWDIAGAARFGLRCIWINRTGQPDEYPDLPPEGIVPTLDALVEMDV
jgi:2-haloacid dehalogenase